VQETRDGELVVFHDANLLRAFPLAGPNVPAFEQLASQGIQRDKASPQVCALLATAMTAVWPLGCIRHRRTYPADSHRTQKAECCTYDLKL
jgi:hypothetical protein